jgi:AcrR family transcriptional regulator
MESRAGARERIVETAYELFSRHGIRAVGVDRVVAEAGVAKMTLYHHFASKEELVLAFLELRGQRWTRDWLGSEIEKRATSPSDRLLVVFDAFDEWFHEPDFESCPFIRTLLETPGRPDSAHQAAVHQVEVVRLLIESLARDCGASPEADLSYQLQTLMMGAIVSATRGDLDAARRVRPLAEQLVEQARA